jgi:hypothetical protein
VVDAFPDYRWELDHLLIDNCWIAAHFHDTGTHRGIFLGVPATGRSVATQEFAVYRVTAGKITEVWVTADNLGLLADRHQPPFLRQRLHRAADHHWSGCGHRLPCLLAADGVAGAHPTARSGSAVCVEIHLSGPRRGPGDPRLGRTPAGCPAGHASIAAACRHHARDATRTLETLGLRPARAKRTRRGDAEALEVAVLLCRTVTARPSQTVKLPTWPALAQVTRAATRVSNV